MADLLTQKTISLSSAVEAIEAGRRSAEEMGALVAIVVVDNAGTLKALMRMDGSQVLSVQVAIYKAYTSAVTGAPTSALGDLCQSQPRVLAALPHVPQISTMGGGTLIVVGEDIVGAVGVSGGTEAQDTAVSQVVADFAAG